MTLPNRPGYSVPDKRSLEHSAPSPIHSQHSTTDILRNIPQFLHNSSDNGSSNSHSSDIELEEHHQHHHHSSNMQGSAMTSPNGQNNHNNLGHGHHPGHYDPHSAHNNMNNMPYNMPYMNGGNPAELMRMFDKYGSGGPQHHHMPHAYPQGGSGHGYNIPPPPYNLPTGMHGEPEHHPHMYQQQQQHSHHGFYQQHAPPPMESMGLGNFCSRYNDLFKLPSGSGGPSSEANSVPVAVIEEQLMKKNFIRSHKMLPMMMQLLISCKKEGIIPTVSTPMENFYNNSSMDFSLDNFLQAQGIEGGHASHNGGDEKPESHGDQERQEFLIRLEQLKFRYNEELERLNQICGDICTRTLIILREQNSVRPVTEHETQARMASIQHKFDYVRNQLRQNVYNAIISIAKQFNQVKPKKRTLPKKASEMLSNWFYEHINDPYPSEEEKTMMAAQIGITMVQLNNWFGNKRIRYKRKCLDREAKGHTAATAEEIKSMIKEDDEDQLLE